jgi:hypothetical protein
MGEGNVAEARGGGRSSGGRSFSSHSRSAFRSHRPSRIRRSKAKRSKRKATAKKHRRKGSRLAKGGKGKKSGKHHHKKHKKLVVVDPGVNGQAIIDDENFNGDDDDNDNGPPPVVTPSKLCIVVVKGYGPCRCGVVLGCDGYAGVVDADADNDPGDQDADQEVVKQTRRYLRVKNDTEKTLTVYLQYRALTEEGWEWCPAPPGDAAKVAVFKVPAGQTVHLIHDNFRVNASRVRIWTAEQTQYKDQDLWLVPEVDEEGNHCYVADEMETYTVAFQNQPAK